MHAVSADFLEALRNAPRLGAYVEAYYAGLPLSFTDADGLTTTRLPLRGDAQNQVTVDGSTAGPRRTLSLTLAPLPGLWDLLSPIGTELQVFTTMEFTNGVTETVPQGVFVVDVQRMGYASSGDLQITAPDRWGRLTDTSFLIPRSSDAGLSVRVEIADLINVVYPSLTVLDTATSTAQVPPQVWDNTNCGKVIQELAKSASLDVYFDRTGTPVVRDAPTLSAGPVWLVDASATGVLIDAQRERNRQHTYNIIKVSAPANSEGGDLFDPVYVWDNNPLSPTFAGTGSGSGTTFPAANTAGPFGQRCYFYSSPLITDGTQAIAAGVSLLEKLSGLAAQLTLTAAPNPALDDGDTIQVVLPPERYDIPRPVERHIVDKLTVPLTPKGSQSIDTRSTVADIDESGA